MAEKKDKRKLEDYSKMSRKDLGSIVEDIHEMKHDERMKHTSAVLTEYHRSGVIDAEYNKASAEIEFGKKAEAMQGLYKKLNEEHHKKEGDLEQSVTTTWLKKFADQIMPAMHVGAEGYTEENYQGLMRYLREFDEEQGMKGKFVEEVKTLIKKGKGHAATAKIIEAISSVVRANEYENLMELLLPKDHHEFIAHASKKMADEINKTLEGKSYEVNPAKISERFVPMYQNYAIKNYAVIIENCKSKKPKEK